MRILIINLTRLGDIIQSLGLIRGLKLKYTDCKLDFLAMSSFAGILQTIPEIDEIISLDDKILVDEIQKEFWNAFLELHQKIDYLSKRQYNLIVNPVISLQSSWLCSLIQAHEKKGMIVNNDGEQSVRSNWSGYLLANQHNLGDHAFNLVNIFAGIADCNFPLNRYHLKADFESESTIQSLFQSDQIKPERKIIGIHAGASQSNKSWSLDYFKKLIINLANNPKHEIILFGGYKETDIKDFFTDIPYQNFHNWIGKLNLNQLISAISHTDLFICNDTGPMHIAACSKVPIINLSLGPVSMWETGPYTDNAIVLQAKLDCHPCSFSYQCPHWNCHYLINPEAVFQLACSVLNHTSLPELDPDILYWKSVTDPFGYIHWVPLIKREISQKEILFELKRVVWGINLNHLFSNADSVISYYIDFIEQYYFTSSFDFSELFKICSNLTRYCSEIITGLINLSENIQNSKINLDKIKTIWSNVKELKDTMLYQAQQYSVIYDWFLYLTFEESQIENDDLKVLTLKTIELYRDLTQQLSLLQNSVIKYHIH